MIYTYCLLRRASWMFRIRLDKVAIGSSVPEISLAVLVTRLDSTDKPFAAVCTSWIVPIRRTLELNMNQRTIRCTIVMNPVYRPLLFVTARPHHDTQSVQSGFGIVQRRQQPFGHSPYFVLQIFAFRSFRPPQERHNDGGKRAGLFRHFQKLRNTVHDDCRQCIGR
jgi:hypothetical protein